jgi:hypothetical protein
MLVLTLHTGTERGHVRSEPTHASSPLPARWGNADSTSYEVLHLSAPEIDALMSRIPIPATAPVPPRNGCRESDEHPDHLDQESR